MLTITTLITRIVELYGKSPKDINNGLCENFAQDVCKQWSGVDLHGVEDFQCDGEFDWDLLGNSYWNIQSPKGFTTTAINNAGLSGHVWIVFDKKHYDAECPDGVDSFFDLPYFQRQLHNVL